MQREELVKAIIGPPALRVGKRLRAMLANPETQPEEIPCAHPDCFNLFVPREYYGDGKRRVKKYCSNHCAFSVLGQNTFERAGKTAGDKRRGSNPDRHISKRVNGQRIYLHRYIVLLESAHTLEDGAIVHHRDENKHHNCYGSQLCDVCASRLFLFLVSLSAGFMVCASLYILKGYGNLEVLTGDAARQHIAYHQRRMQAARRVKK